MEKRRRTLGVALALGILSSCTATGGSSPPGSAAVASPDAMPSMTVAARLNAAPGGCSTSGVLIRDVAPWGALFGSAPAFGAFYARADRSANAFHVGSNTRRTRDGWVVKVLWLLEPGTTQPVTLSGYVVDTNSQINFDPSDGSASPSMRLDPAQPGTPNHRPHPGSLVRPPSPQWLPERVHRGGAWPTE
jgi:hypothetical protein